MLYTASEVCEVFGITDDKALMALVRRDKFPAPIQATRETTKLWTGRSLRRQLRRMEFEAETPPAEKSQKKTGDDDGDTQGALAGN